MKSVMITCINTFMGICNVIDNVLNKNVNFNENMSSLKAIKSYFKSQDKRKLHSWSLGSYEGSFNKFHLK